MSAETLRRAASAMRVDNPPCCGAGDVCCQSVDFHLAVADWLDEVADIRRVISGLAKYSGDDPLGGSDCFLNMEAKALAVARATAYLGEPCTCPTDAEIDAAIAPYIRTDKP